MPEIQGRVNAAAATIVLVYATFPSIEVADAIAGEVVAARLAACANLVPGMRSIYRWEGTLHRDEEVSAILKTRADLADRLIGYVRVAHPYVNPALVMIPAIGGSPSFLAWIGAETRSA